VRITEYWKFPIKSNSYFSIRNEHHYSKFSNTYRYWFLTYLTEWRRFFTLATMPSNQQNLLLTMVQVLYVLEVFILAHYGPSSTETPTTETTIERCHKNSWIYLTSTYYWWLLRPTNIRFDSKFQIIAQLFDSKWKKHHSHSTNYLCHWLLICTIAHVFQSNSDYTAVKWHSAVVIWK